VTHVVPHNLRPCVFAQHAAGMHAAKAPKAPLSPRLAESDVSRQQPLEHSRASAVRSLKTREACRLSRLTGSCSQPCVPSRLGNQTGQRSRIYARERMPLSLELAESESLQMVVANIRGRNGIRVCTCVICHRFVYASVYGSQEDGVDVARIRPGDHRCHT